MRRKQEEVRNPRIEARSAAHHVGNEDCVDRILGSFRWPRTRMVSNSTPSSYPFESPAPAEGVTLGELEQRALSPA